VVEQPNKERLENFKCHFSKTSNIKRTETLGRSANPGSTFSMQRKYGYLILGVLLCCIQRDLSGIFLSHTSHLINKQSLRHQPPVQSTAFTVRNLQSPIGFKKYVFYGD
jgi:hypothetical protein